MTDRLSDELATRRLGYLLKHAQQRLMQTAAPAMAPFGIDGRELAVLTVLATDLPLSQQEAAERLGVDRTTMVALTDTLEAKGLVERHRSAEDRRKNLVQLTPVGRDCLVEAGEARDEVEREFLAPLGDRLAAEFIRALRILAISPSSTIPSTTSPG
jgi:DNA-binding MarR family transcriptional regulator